MIRLFFLLGKVLSLIYPYSLRRKVNNLKTFLYTGLYSKDFADLGIHSFIAYRAGLIKSMDRIRIGNNSYIGKNVVLTAWKSYQGKTYSPSIMIGNGCSIGEDNHITSICNIYIGNNVLTGRKVLITDNSHGNTLLKDLDIEPVKRELYSKGPVIIEDNVWIGEKASIMPGVKIGKGSVIAANSVVTRDVPAYCVVAGCPARIIKDCININ